MIRVTVWNENIHEKEIPGRWRIIPRDPTALSRNICKKKPR